MSCIGVLSVGQAFIFIPVYRIVYLSISCGIFFKAMAPSILIGLIRGLLCHRVLFANLFPSGIRSDYQSNSVNHECALSF